MTEAVMGDSRARVGVGSTVTLAAPDGKAVTFTVVKHWEADTIRGRVSTEASVARAVIGREVGEFVMVPTPREERPYRIVAA